MLRDLVIKSRSYRRFYEDVDIPEDVLKRFVDVARLCPSGANKQPLKYIVSVDRERNAEIFKHLAWAGYLSDWPGPSEGERPAGYIIILGDTEISKQVACDHGIAAQTIMLSAAEKDLGGCIVGSVRRPELQRALGIPARFEILLVLALGKPKERVKIEHLASGDDIEYWRDKQLTHHVPKRSLESVIVQIQ